MKENVKNFYIFQTRQKYSKTGKWVDNNWSSSLKEARERRDKFLEYRRNEKEIPESRIICRTTYDEVVE